jgi:3-phosphoshikimate 1-carboxyvinyltransferase
VQFLVKPSTLTGGTVAVPGDKSISHRALMFNAIASGTAHISGFLAGEDCLRSMAALQALGVSIESDAATSMTVHGRGLHGLSAPVNTLDLGNSGTAMRLFCGLLAGQEFDSVLAGDASLSGRPMGRVIEPLTRMGASIESNDGKPPLRIRGGRKLLAMNYAMPVASAQVKSALLLAGLYCDGTTCVSEPAVTRDHTERMLLSMGANLEKTGSSVSLQGANELRAVDVAVPADLSSAAFPLVAAIVAEDAEVTVRNVGINPSRTGFLDILMQMGADICISNEQMLGNEPVADITARSSALRGRDVDPDLVSLAIDEFPVLFAAAALADGITRFSGLAELRVKESDRIGAMAEGLTRLGISVQETADGATIKGGTLGGGEIDSCGDHRIAMAFASIAGRASAALMISDTDPVDTSFPGFVDCVRSIGLQIEVRGGASL